MKYVLFAAGEDLHSFSFSVQFCLFLRGIFVDVLLSVACVEHSLTSARLPLATQSGPRALFVLSLSSLPVGPSTSSMHVPF